MATLALKLPEAALADFCRRWGVELLEVFGSILRDDFRPDSDVDFLVTWRPGARPPLFDQLTMQDELASLLGRRVDLVPRDEVETSPNGTRRAAILRDAHVVFRA